jgi:uncharacterized membrane protein YjjP (DUF1212 family)
MSDRQDDRGAVPAEDGRPVPMAGHVAARTGRFSREVVATMISLASAAFGVVAALAWNEAITTAFAEYFGDAAQISALFVYAVVVTLIGVVVIVLLARVAARINAQPVEFRYPGVPKS